MALTLKTIQEKVAHNFYAQGYAPFIRIKIRIVKRSHGFLSGAFNTQEKIEAWNFLAVIREILSYHLGSYLFDEPQENGIISSLKVIDKRYKTVKSIG